MVVNPYYSDYVPASGSSMQNFSVSANTISSECFSTLNLSWLCFIDEEDKIYQTRQRNLRYAPFRVMKKSMYKSKPVLQRPRLFQIMPKPVRIGRNV